MDRGKGRQSRSGGVVGENENRDALDFSGTEVAGVDLDDDLAGLGADALLRLALALPARDEGRIISKWDR